MRYTNLKDGLKYEDDTEILIFNHYSFCEILKHIMVKYGGITYTQAEGKLQKSSFIEIPKSKLSVELLSHELEFHYAMLITHGNMYWLKGIPSDFNEFREEYLEWESETRQKFNLKDSFEYHDKNS